MGFGGKGRGGSKGGTGRGWGKMVAQLDDEARNQIREKLLEYDDEADEALLDYVVLVRPSGSSNVYKDAMASDGSADGSIERPGKGGRAA
jgi:hypothetical protein